MTQGRYHVSFLVSQPSATSQDFSVTPILSGAALSQYAAHTGSTAGANAVSAAGSIILDVPFTSTLEFRIATDSADAQCLLTNVAILKLS